MTAFLSEEDGGDSLTLELDGHDVKDDFGCLSSLDPVSSVPE